MHINYTTKVLTVTLAKPVFTKANEPRVVVATDIPLTASTGFVHALKVSETGVAFIVKKNGNLIATSSTKPPFSAGADATNPQAARLCVDRSADPLIRQAYGQLQRSTNARTTTVRGVNIAGYSCNGDTRRVHMSATAQRGAAGLDWTMEVAIPRPDHMGNVWLTILENVAIGLLAAAFALAAALWVMNRVTSDVRRLSEATGCLRCQRNASPPPCAATICSRTTAAMNLCC